MSSHQLDNPDSGSLYRTGAHMTGDSGGTGGDGYTFPPWNPGDAQTVDLLDTQNPPVDDKDNGGGVKVSPVIAFLVCFAVLAVFIILIVIAVIRAKRRRSFTPPTQPPKDEEEGLLQLPPQEDSSTKQEPEDPMFAGSAKNRRETAKDRKQGTDDDVSDEDEETPMLKKMEPSDTSQAPGEQIEMSNFQEMIDNLPMIDEMEMSDDDMYPITLRSPQKEAFPPLYRRDSGDLEWDPQMDTATPLPSEEGQEEENGLLRPVEERGRVGQKPPPPSQPPPLEETEGSDPDSYYGVPREVWTESQVLGAMDIIIEESSEESEPSWDHSGDTSASLHGQDDGSLPSLSETQPTTSPENGDPSNNNNEANMEDSHMSGEDTADPKLEEYSNRETLKIREDEPAAVDYNPVPTLRRMNDFDSEPDLDTEPVEIEVTADVHRSRGNSESLSRNMSEERINDQNQNNQGPYNGTHAGDHGNMNIATNGNYETGKVGDLVKGHDKFAKKRSGLQAEARNGVSGKECSLNSISKADQLNSNGNNNNSTSSDPEGDHEASDSKSELCSQVSDSNEGKLPLIPQSKRNSQKDHMKHKISGKR